jgi:catechol 2,3-dioxygenase-like lactoylglutathione lyase family enzyme
MDTKVSSSNVHPKILNHIGVSVPNLEAAVKWYKDILGFTTVNRTVEFVVDDSLAGMMLKDIYEPKLKKMKVAFLSSVIQIGFEIFESVVPKAERYSDNFEYWKPGFFHICITDPDIEGLRKRISDSGGKQRSKIWEIVPEKGYKIAFCEDPFGNIIEIFDHSYEQIITSL